MISVTNLRPEGRDTQKTFNELQVIQDKTSDPAES